ncbi:hypothetical protein QBC38DRAFT_530985 [Podospora fimiseda]|uniref:Uncharacterized protein n=1 Tax=Podospora fimiseda TaxID=252190 RepID=A0AAN7BL91_9PEZI|nr:hypothetical protein QBC38DRAFT_530985 [Podospora fimiseda]
MDGRPKPDHEEPPSNNAFPRSRLPGNDLPDGPAPLDSESFCTACQTPNHICNHIPGGILRCEHISPESCEHRYNLDQLIIVVDCLMIENKWLSFKAFKNGRNFGWSIPHMDSPVANNLRYYQPRKIVVAFEGPSNTGSESAALLLALRAKEFDVFNILNNIRPKHYTLDQSHLKVRLNGDFNFWARRLDLPSIRNEMKPYYHEYLVIPLIAHWAWKDAELVFEGKDLHHSNAGDWDSLERHKQLVTVNSIECEEHLLDGRMYVPPGIERMVEEDEGNRKEKLRQKKEDFDKTARDVCQLGLSNWKIWNFWIQTLQSVREAVGMSHCILESCLDKGDAEIVSQLAQHIVRADSRSDKDSFSSASASSTEPVGMKGYVVRDYDGLPHLLSSRTLRDGFTEWAKKQVAEKSDVEAS